MASELATLAPLLNLLVLPVIGILVKLEHRLTQLETQVGFLEQDINLLNAKVSDLLAESRR